MADDSWKTAECPDCGEEADADQTATEEQDFISYECPNGHFFMKQA